MRRPLTFSLLASAALTAALTSDSIGLLRSSGPPNDRCGAPPSFATCTACHTTNDINTGGGAMLISGLPEVYVPGQLYTLDIEVSDPAAARWGFEITALDESLDGAGSFTALNNEVQVSISGTVEYAKHTSTGTSPGQTGSKVWQVEWVAPSAGTGPINFYAAGVGANGNSSSSGDQVYNAAIAMAESASEDASVIMQPPGEFVTAGTFWDVEAYVRDHSGANNQVLLVTRVMLPNGSFFPSSGWLFPPATINLTPGAEDRRTLRHLIPPTAPSLTATYQAFIGRAPGTLVNLDEFQFTIR